MMVLLWSRTNTDAIKEKDRREGQGEQADGITLVGAADEDPGRMLPPESKFVGRYTELA